MDSTFGDTHGEINVLIDKKDSFSPDHDFKITYVFVFAIIYFVLFIAYFNDVDNNLRIG